MDISVIIPSFNRHNLLKWNLLSLVNQFIISDVEVIVLNDGLEDATADICYQYKDRLNLKYIFTGQRNKIGNFIWRIPGYAINIGVKQSSGDIIILCCAEMFHANSSIDLITSVLHGEDADKIIAIPQGKDDNGSFLRHVELTNGNFEMYEYDRQPKLDNVRLPFFMAMKRNAFIDIGGYDEDFTGTDFDDNDFVDRLIKNGCNHVETPAKIIHLWHNRLPMTSERKIRYDYNKKLYEERKDVIIRNAGKEWGIL